MKKVGPMYVIGILSKKLQLMKCLFFFMAFLVVNHCTADNHRKVFRQSTNSSARILINLNDDSTFVFSYSITTHHLFSGNSLVKGKYVMKGDFIYLKNNNDIEMIFNRNERFDTLTPVKVFDFMEKDKFTFYGDELYSPSTNNKETPSKRNDTLESFIKRVNTKKTNILKGRYEFIPFFSTSDTEMYYSPEVSAADLSEMETILFDKREYSFYVKNMRLFHGRYKVIDGYVYLNNKFGPPFIFSIHKKHLYPIRFWENTIRI